uniref:Major facilitator superfamily (MFS) profile domain-containing protein n=1 Tax=Ditylenchus dipsaci TaxID=166011 RepID=A0A915ERY8_9BILA
MQTNDFILKRIRPSWRPHVVIGAGIVIQFTYGLVYTFGNILPYLVSYFRWYIDPSQTSGSFIWLQSLMGGIPFAMLAGGYIEKRIGARRGIILASTIYTLRIYCSFGTLSSIGAGIGYNCVLINCQKWLRHRIGFVSGLVTAGFGSGAFVLAPLQTKYINPDNFSADKDGYFTQVELLERVPKLFLVMACLFAVLQFVAVFFIGEPSYTEVVEQEEEESHPDQPSVNEEEPPVLSCKEAMLSGTCAVFFCSLFLNGVYVQTISGLYKAFGQTFIKDDFFLATVNSLAAASNCMSRVIWGLVADKTSYQSAMSVACAVGAALMWTLGAVKLAEQPMLFLIWVCLMYWAVGATYSLVPYAVHHSFGATHFGIVYGFVQLSLPFSGITTALCSQFLLSTIGYEMLFAVIAGTICTSFFLTSLVLQHTKYGKVVC